MHAPLDEMVDGRGGLRPHWRGLWSNVAGLGREAIATRTRMLERAAHDEGLAPWLSGARQATWRSDPIPLPLPAAEFAVLADGLVQRATLLDAVLADLYGPQSLLAEGALPPALVFANPLFLRPCRVVDGPPRRPLLQFYAADLARAPDGRWRVLADFTDTPQGAVHALENRRTIARLCPELFRSQSVWRLQPFFDVWQDALRGLALAPHGHPELAVLTAGGHDAARFEHVRMARELSCTLVESGDLTVRDGLLLLKTLRGLRPLDLLLRCQPGDTVDPLELPSDAAGGMPGLLEAMRSGAVRVVNDPGTALAQSPALAAYLPDLCRRLLEEELVVGSVPTLWLGDARAAETVRRAPQGWVIRSAFESAEKSPAFAGARPPDGAAPLLAATARLTLSVAPSVQDDDIVPLPIMLRLFLVSDGERWHVMHGGLARIVPDGDCFALATEMRIKDVWVPMEEEAEFVGPPEIPLLALPIRRLQGDLPARIAEDFFCFGRYLERLEGMARLLRSVIARAREVAPTPREIAEIVILSACLAERGVIGGEAASLATAAALADALQRAAADDAPPHRLLGRISRLVDQLRDQLTVDMVRACATRLRHAREDLDRAGRNRDGRAMERLSDAAERMLDLAATVAGLAAENMVRGGGRLFLDLGRRLQRAETIAAELAILLSPHPPVVRAGQIEAGLRLALELRDSLIAYRTRYLAAPQPAPVLDLVLADEGNPRALAYQLAAARDMMAEIAGEPSSPFAREAASILAHVHDTVLAVAAAPDPFEASLAVPARLAAIGTALHALSENFSRAYFDFLPLVQAIGPETDAPSLMPEIA